MADLLHHGTSITGFCHIAFEDMLGAYGGECQASFTTDEDMGRHFAKAAVTMCSEGQLAQYADFFAVEHDGWDGRPSPRIGERSPQAEREWSCPSTAPPCMPRTPSAR